MTCMTPVTHYKTSQGVNIIISSLILHYVKHLTMLCKYVKHLTTLREHLTTLREHLTTLRKHLATLREHLTLGKWFMVIVV